MTQEITPAPIADLLPQQQRINALLQQFEIKDELQVTRNKSNQAYGEKREKVLKNPPRFRFVAEFHSAVYDRKTQKVYEGLWSDYHSWVALKAGSIQIIDEYKNNQAVGDLLPGKRFISAASFQLRGGGGKVIILDTLYLVDGQEVNTLQNLGYSVMNPELKWLIPIQDKNLFIETSSPLSRR